MEKKSNNPPDVVLELTKDQAQFLLKNCDSNMKLALNLITQCSTQKEAEPYVKLNEQFKSIRSLLVKQGVSSE